jgi:hypothetical protein
VEQGLNVSGWNLCRYWCLGTAPDLFCRSHRIQNAFNDLLGPGTVCHVGRLNFEEFGVCEHDAELVVQLVKQHAELWIRSEIVHAGANRPTQRG